MYRHVEVNNLACSRLLPGSAEAGLELTTIQSRAQLPTH